MNSPHQRIKRNFGIALSSSVVAGVLGLLALAINTRALSLTEIGSLTIVQAYAWLINGLVTFSTHVPLMRMGSAAVEEDETDRLYGLVRLAFIVDIAAGIVAAAVAYGWSNLPSGMFGLSPVEQAGLQFYAIPLIFAGLASGGGILRLVDRFDVLRTTDILAASGTIAAALLLWLLGAPLTTYFAAYAIIFGVHPLVRYIAAVRLLRRHFPHERSTKSRLRQGDAKGFIRFAGYASLASSIETIRNSMDTVIAAYLFSKEAVGIYAVAKQLAGAVRRVTAFTTEASFVEVSRMFARGEVSESKRLFGRVVQVSAALGAVATVGAMLFGGMALSIGFGPAYQPGYAVLVILVLAAGVQFVSTPMTMYVQVIQGAGWSLIASVLALAAFLMTIFVLTPLLGIEGIAVASVIYFAVTLAVGFLVVRRGLRSS